MKKFLKTSKRVIALMIVLLMCFSVNIFATEDFQEMEAQVIQSEGNDGHIKLVFEDENGEVFNASEDLEFSSSSVARKASSLPSKFDARDVDGVNYVTPVKNQGVYGTCWTFGANSALEARAIELGLGSSTNIDFSEAFLAWFGYNSYISNTASGMYGDGIATGSKAKIPMTTLSDIGGNPSFAIAAYSVGSGINTESDFPYSIVENGSSIAESKRYNSKFRLLEGKTVLDYYPDNMTEAERVKYVNTIKTALIKYKVLDCGAYFPVTDAEIAKYVNEDSTKDIYAQYQTAKGENAYYLSNHEVSIIGYDDSFPKENFNANNQPEGDGAWLIKNSWGTNLAGSGYTWISYYDESVSDVTAYEIGAKSSYDYTYQYDGTIPTYSIGLRSPNLSTANVFTSSRNETLNRVGFYTVDSNIKYTISVYKNLTSKAKPTSGTKVASVSGTADFSGYHTVPINNTYIKKGATFSVVVSFTNSNGNSYTYIEDLERMQLFGANIYVYQAAKTNQSFIKSGNTWLDLRKNGYGNVPIKAFTKRINLNGFSLNKKTIYLNQNSTASVGYKTTPSNATCSVTGKSSDTKIATFSSGKVKGVKAGKTTVTVTATDGIKKYTSKFTVIVRPKPPTKVKAAAGKKRATITYKKTPGATGYAIYRSTKKTSGFKKVKTLTGAKYVNKGLKSRKTYYYKVKAYKTINGKKQYGKYSARVRVKVK